MEATLTENELDKQFNSLTAQTELSKKLNINPSAIRPCIARMWSIGFVKVGYWDRSLISSILATELLRIDCHERVVEDELREWNKKNDPPIKLAEIKSTIRTAKRKNYNYSCHHDYVREFCIGEELCMLKKGNLGNRQINYRSFFTYKWQKILHNSSKLVYWLALPEIEKKTGLKAGDRLYVGQREIADFAGITTKSVKNALDELFAYGLIKYKPGVPRKWEKKATEVIRVFPIPKPPKEARKRPLKKCKSTTRESNFLLHI